MPSHSVSAAAPAAKRDLPAQSGTSIRHSLELFGSSRELLIEHAGFVYRLRITQNNKLILTK